MAHQVADLDARLAVGGELRPVAGDRRVEVELPRSASIRAVSAVIVLVVE